MMTKKIQLLKEDKEEKPNPGGVVGSTSATPPGPPDRISELPVEILHHILGFLDMDELLIQTSLVSTKWRNLWKSVSTLNFNHCRPGSHSHNVEKYQNFVDHVLRLRDSEASKIQIFKYYCHDSISREGGGGGGYEDYLEHLHNFIVSAAVKQGAEEIEIRCFDLDESSDDDIIIIPLNPYILNPSIFNSSGGLLRKFTFAVLNFNFQIQFPRSMCCAATQLTHLTLYNIRLPEGNDDSSNAAQLHLVCPLLETLFISNCISEHLKVLDISAPKLNTLTIKNRCMRLDHFDGLGGCRIEIHTPNLTSLLYSGCVYVDCFMENLPRIADARLHFTKERGMAEQTTSFAIKLLKGLTTAEALTLAGFEVFPEDVLKELLKPFTSIRTLCLATCHKISSIHGMVHIFNSCNSIEKLRVYFVGNIRKVESDEHLMHPQCRLSHLKHVHIVRLHGHKNEIEFVKFLLKNSVVLEDIIIQTTTDSPKQAIEENLKKFIKEEPTLRRSIKLKIL